MSENRFRSLAIDIVLAVCFVLIAISVIRGCSRNVSKPSEGILSPQVAKESDKKIEPASYSLDKARAASSPAAPGQASDLEEAYELYPKSGAGGNIVKEWARIKPEDKARIQENLDNDIKVSEEALRADPNDKKAKNRLFISRTLKELTSKSFNIKPGDLSAMAQAEDPSKTNK
ncbi:MAG: hypothetical protein V1682_07720 [Candidatus Omnitrophota bacterium]